MQFCSLQATGFLPIITWIHTFSSIYSSLSCWSQKLRFTAEPSQKLQSKGAGISISSRGGDGGPSSVSTVQTLPNGIRTRGPRAD